MPAFVWMKSLVSPQPQKIIQELRGADGSPVSADRILAIYVISDEEACLPLDVLCQMYPYKEPDDEVS